MIRLSIKSKKEFIKLIKLTSHWCILSSRSNLIQITMAFSCSWMGFLNSLRFCALLRVRIRPIFICTYRANFTNTASFCSIFFQFLSRLPSNSWRIRHIIWLIMISSFKLPALYLKIFKWNMLLEYAITISSNHRYRTNWVFLNGA